MKNNHLLGPKDFRWGGDFWKMIVRFALFATGYYFVLFALTAHGNRTLVIALLCAGWAFLAYVSYKSVKV